ncbi:MAG: hypothetical protein D6808_06455 [Candidatus Dadabacteria bacterium]|nr:MAG: hypothetical protein D6808_06455 [Candidatus Dadabacteria bacterium]
MLEQNYRSTQNILDVANSIIKVGKKGNVKTLWTEREGGDPIFTYVAEDEEEEASFVADKINALVGEGRYKYGDFAVFYRVNAQSRAIEEAMLNEGIPYRIYGGVRFYDRKEIKDIIAYLRLIVNENDDHAFLRVVNTPPRGVGSITVGRLIEEGKKCGSLFHCARKAERSAGLKAFVSLIEELREFSRDAELEAIVRTVIEKSGYDAMLNSSKDEQSQSRLENLQELVFVAMSYRDVGKEAIQAFLDNVTLISAQDRHSSEGGDSSKGHVSLMTLHVAKGLEFPVVFLTGFENGLLPHIRSIEEGNFEEERRLCYVGVTRAKDILFLTRAETRGLFSSGFFREISPFALSIPDDKLEDLSGDFKGYAA